MSLKITDKDGKVMAKLEDDYTEPVLLEVVCECDKNCKCKKKKKKKTEEKE